jgi:hypothetical protein
MNFTLANLSQTQTLSIVAVIVIVLLAVILKRSPRSEKFGLVSRLRALVSGKEQFKTLGMMDRMKMGAQSMKDSLMGKKSR